MKEQGQTEATTFLGFCRELVDTILKEEDEEPPEHPFPVRSGSCVLPLTTVAQAAHTGDPSLLLASLPDKEHLKDFPRWMLKGCNDGMLASTYKRTVADNLLAHPDVQGMADTLSKEVMDAGAGTGRAGMSSLLGLSFKDAGDLASTALAPPLPILSLPSSTTSIFTTLSAPKPSVPPGATLFVEVGGTASPAWTAAAYTLSAAGSKSIMAPGTGWTIGPDGKAVTFAYPPSPPSPLGLHEAMVVATNIASLVAQPSFPPLERCPIPYKPSLTHLLRSMGTSYATFITAASTISHDSVRQAACIYFGSVFFSGRVLLFGEGSIPPTTALWPLFSSFDAQQAKTSSAAAMKAASEAAAAATRASYKGGGARGGGGNGAEGGGGGDSKKARDNNSNPKASGSGKIASWTAAQLVTHFSAMSPYPPAWVSKANWDKERPQGSCKYHLPPIVGAKRQARGPQCDGTDASCHWKVLFSKGASVLEAHPTSRYIKTHSVIPPEVGQSARSANAGKDWLGGLLPPPPPLPPFLPPLKVPRARRAHKSREHGGHTSPAITAGNPESCLQALKP